MSTTTFSTYYSFDLFDFVHDIKEVYVAAQVAQSTAWRIDTLIKQQANALFKQVRESLASTVDSYADITASLKEIEFAQVSFNDAGLQHDQLTTLQQLVHMRDQWQELAKEYVGMTTDWKGQPRRYEYDSIDDLFFNKLTTNAEEVRLSAALQSRLRVQATRRAEAYDVPEQAQALLERKLQREKQNMADMNQRMNDNAPAVFNIFKLACGCECGEITTAFNALPLDTQRLLIANAQQAAERADDFAAKERNMTDSEYDCICLCSMSTIKRLRDVLRAPKFVTDQRVREAA